jgi:hypothetical protein
MQRGRWPRRQDGLDDRSRRRVRQRGCLARCRRLRVSRFDRLGSREGLRIRLRDRAGERRDRPPRSDVCGELVGNQGRRDGARGVSVLPRFGRSGGAGEPSARRRRRPRSQRLVSGRRRRSRRRGGVFNVALAPRRLGRPRSERNGADADDLHRPELLERSARRLAVRERSALGRKLGRKLPRHPIVLERVGDVAVRGRRQRAGHLGKRGPRRAQWLGRAVSGAVGGRCPIARRRRRRPRFGVSRGRPGAGGAGRGRRLLRVVRSRKGGVGDVRERALCVRRASSPAREVLSPR